MAEPPRMTPAQRRYEEKRAARAGVSLDRWLADKKRAAERAAREQVRADKPATAAARAPGLFGRILARANRPLGQKPPPSK